MRERWGRALFIEVVPHGWNQRTIDSGGRGRRVYPGLLATGLHSLRWIYGKSGKPGSSAMRFAQLPETPGSGSPEVRNEIQEIYYVDTEQRHTR